MVAGGGRALRRGGGGGAHALDAKPLAGAEVTLFRKAGFYDGRKVAATLRTDAAGRIAAVMPDAGRYLLLVRNRVVAPPGGAAPYLSYTVTLAIEAS